MKKAVTGAVVLLLLFQISYAAPQVGVKDEQISVDYGRVWFQNEPSPPAPPGASYTAGEYDGRYAFTYGMPDNYAIYVGPGLIRPVIYPTNGNTLDVHIQKRVDENWAAFAGVKRFSGSWVVAEPAAADNGAINKLEVGVIGQNRISDHVAAYAKVGFTGDNLEYRTGVTYYIRDIHVDLGYYYQQLSHDSSSTPLSANSSGDGAGQISQGIYLGANYRF
ncbi:Hypothetical protein LUCI_5192 [Lucifera butyrica]|uniref:Outer membrane protein beta-barrel domain-containing protein n=1 Tax=Lucifera butyrica TaxID=1351585 RepID=A0A498REG8_9FIRM|nr:hypothetical protein [Lucifera butyrica]VBB09894.1 Hypothetical protein LUCI_5192 [Lucifera butyrica]